MKRMPVIALRIVLAQKPVPPIVTGHALRNLSSVLK
jgi:hypothetical protein